MKKIILSVLVVAALMGCGKKDITPPDQAYILENLMSTPFIADQFLVEKIDSLSLIAVSETKIVRPDSAESYFGQAASNYLNHWLVGSVSRKYLHIGDTVYVEINQFADETSAYGFYARSRPHGMPFDKIGTGSFQVGNSRYMNRGDYVVTISCEQSQKLYPIIQGLAEDLNQRMFGPDRLPVYYMLFPVGDKIFPSSRYYPWRMLDIPGLDQVYTTAYANNNDTMTLFLALDSIGEKFTYLSQYAKNSEQMISNIKKFKFPEEKSLALNHPKYGIIMAGYINGKLFGVIDYKPANHDRTIQNWFKGLK